jgi:hypothetical protein
MKIWFTRPSLWDLWVRGIDRSVLWLQKPFYDTSPRGEEREIPRYAHLPIGWRVVDPVYGDISAQVSMTVGEVLPPGQYDNIANALWDALCRSVDDRGPDEDGGTFRRFQVLLDNGLDPEADEQVMSTFLFEYDAPPDLWFSVAWANGVQTQAAAGQWAQKIFEVDTEFGIEADDPPPIANPPIRYFGLEVCIPGTKAANETV